MTTVPPTQLAELALPGGADKPRQSGRAADSAAARTRANRFEHVLRSTSGSARPDSRPEPTRARDREPARSDVSRRDEQRRRDPVERRERPERPDRQEQERTRSHAGLEEKPVARERLDEERGDGRDGPSPRSSSSDDDREATSTDSARNHAADAVDNGSPLSGLGVDETGDGIRVDGDLWSSAHRGEAGPTIDGRRQDASIIANGESIADQPAGVAAVSAGGLEPTIDTPAPVSANDPELSNAAQALDPTAAVPDTDSPELDSEAAAGLVAVTQASTEATGGAQPVTAGATESSVGTGAPSSEQRVDSRTPSGPTGRAGSSNPTQTVGAAGPETGTSGDATSSEQSAESPPVIELSTGRSADALTTPQIGVQQVTAAPSGLDQPATSTVAGMDVQAGNVGAAGLRSNAASAEVARTEAPAGTAAARLADDQDAGDPVWRQVRRALGSIRTTPSGEQQLTIRLRPAELGSIMVRISTGENGTTVALVADSSAAANQLQQQRSLLVSELEESGLRGIAVDVGTSGDAARDQAENLDAGLDDNSSAPGGRASETDQRPDDDPNRMSNHRNRRVRTPSSGLVDLDL